MNQLITFAAITLPDNVKNNLSYGILIVLAVSAVWCVIKCIAGADAMDRGEDGKKKIVSGIAIGLAPWLAVGAFQATGLWNKLGVSMVPTNVVKLPTELVDSIQLALWGVIGIALIWAIAKCVAGADSLERGEDGKKKIFSGIMIGAAPWIAIMAMNMSGFWDALGLSLV